jgi:hypothetical protein
MLKLTHAYSGQRPLRLYRVASDLMALMEAPNYRSLICATDDPRVDAFRSGLDHLANSCLSDDSSLRECALSLERLIALATDTLEPFRRPLRMAYRDLQA